MKGKVRKMMKWIVDGIECDTIDEAVNEVMDNMDGATEFEDEITNEHGYSIYLDVCDGEFDTIDLLQRLGVYDDMFDDWKEEQRDNIRSAIENVGAGEMESVFDLDVECVDEDAELFKGANDALSAVQEWIVNVPSIYSNGKNTALESLMDISTFIEKMEERIMEG